MTDRDNASSEHGTAQGTDAPGSEGATVPRGGSHKPADASSAAEPIGQAPGPVSSSQEPAAAPPEGAPAPADAPSAPTEVESLEAALAAAKQATERTREQMLRVAADYDNFRKRTAREIDDARRRSRQGVIRDMLPVFDNLERAMGATAAADAAAIRDGLRLVIRQFLDTLSKLGIERIDAIGAAFDPIVHESIQMVESAEHRAGTVVSVVQPGYRMGSELLRPAMVIVSRGAPADAHPQPDPKETTAASEPAKDTTHVTATGSQTASAPATDDTQPPAGQGGANEGSPSA
jgi:molecular chaperone GrpE